jgi:hypothetical protein
MVAPAPVEELIIVSISDGEVFFGDGVQFQVVGVRRLVKHFRSSSTNTCGCSMAAK